jgi:NitT/TauT family transport system permease protein
MTAEPLEAPVELPPPAAGNRRARIRQFILVWSLRIVVLVIIIGAWQVTAVTKTLNPLFIGTPSLIAKSLVTQLKAGAFWGNVGVTLEETAFGFVIGAAGGMLAGILLYLVPLLYTAFRPLLVALNTAPRVAFAPLFILWFGLGLVSKIAMGVSLAFFIVMEGTYTGLLQPEREHLLLARTLGYKRLKRLRFFVLPSAVPVIAAGLQLALVYTISAVVVGEFVGGTKGLGVLLSSDANTFDPNDFFAVMIVLIVLTVAIAQAMKAVERAMLRWHVIEMRGTR